MKAEPEDYVRMTVKRLTRGRVFLEFTRPVKSYALDRAQARSLSEIITPKKASRGDLAARIDALETRMEEEPADLDRELDARTHAVRQELQSDMGVFDKRQRGER